MSDVEQPEDERNPAGDTPEEPVEAANEAPEPVAEGEQPADEAAEQPAAQEQPRPRPAARSCSRKRSRRRRASSRRSPVPTSCRTSSSRARRARARKTTSDEATASSDGDADDEIVAQPIADAAISLAADARYTATGKRKTAVARVILKPGTGQYTINGKPLDDFFPRPTLQRNIRQPLEAVGFDERMDVIAKMHGGGVSAQAGALRHGISRALLVADPNLRGELKKRGFLTRDPRVKERKKAGLKKARKRPQFSKR